MGIPFFANALPLNPQQAMSAVLGYVMALVVFGGILAIGYLYIFNRRTRQSLHDLVVGCYVVRAEQSTQDVPIPIMWRGRLVVIAVLATITLGAPALSRRFTQSSAFADLLPLHQSLSIQPHVMNAQVMRGWTSGQGNTMHYLQSQLRLDAPLTADGVLARHVAQLMAKAVPISPTKTPSWWSWSVATSSGSHRGGRNSGIRSGRRNGRLNKPDSVAGGSEKKGSRPSNGGSPSR